MTYSEFNMDEIDGLRQQIVSETGHRTVPVVIDVRNEQPIFIGGFDETQVYLR
jgi:glutaredoxin